MSDIRLQHHILYIDFPERVFFFVAMQTLIHWIYHHKPAVAYLMNDGSLYEGKFDGKSSLSQPPPFFFKELVSRLFHINVFKF